MEIRRAISQAARAERHKHYERKREKQPDCEPQTRAEVEVLEDYEHELEKQ